ncbi:hypothetical protein ONZ45_g6056 [Pleurotus djamor]|nr:hypothetical protein ONZ45_g6056 [Pleurotus djamor]
MRPSKQVHFASTTVLYTFTVQTPEATPILSAKTALIQDSPAPVPAAPTVFYSTSPTKPASRTPKSSTRERAKTINVSPVKALKSENRNKDPKYIHHHHPDHDLKRTHLRRLSLDSQLDERRAIFLHFLLAVATEPYIKFDVSQPPETLVCRFPSSILAEPATSPPLSILAIDASPSCPWPITVTPSSTSPSTVIPHGVGAVVTVWDVLSAIHHALRTPVTMEEYRALPSLDVIKKVNAAYTKRCQRVNDSAEARMEEGMKGVRRVDFLGGMNRFMGLTVDPKYPNVWKMVVST